MDDEDGRLLWKATFIWLGVICLVGLYFWLVGKV